MKITGVRTHVLKSALAQPFAFSQGWVEQRSATLVEITTDSGLSGWGEAFAQGMEAPEISAAAIEHALAPLVLDADPLDIEVLWHRMYHSTRDFGRKGSVTAAISAIDIALWDLAGKHYGVPISKLLGGTFRTEVQPYATGFYRIKGQDEARRLADEAMQHFETGFRSMKIKLGFGVDDDIAVMAAVGVRRGKAALSQWVKAPPGKLLQPEATGATVEATKRLKPPVKRVTTFGDSASVQAVTRVNVEQASKRTLRRPTRLPYRGRLIRLGVWARLIPVAVPG